MVTPKYRCSQDELYQACFLLATSLEEELGKFAFKPRYSQPGFVDTFRDNVRAARLLPDDAQRKAQHIFLRTPLVNSVDVTFRHLAGKLRSYIRDAYPNPTDEAAALDAAGFLRYDAATSYDWDALTGFIIAAITFTEQNQTTLEANLNMPTSFITELKAYRDLIEPGIDAFLNTLENSEDGTQTKILANNAIYEEAIKICEDGQVVFYDNEAKRHQFVWDRIISRITPPGAAGLKVDVRNGATNEFEPGVVLSVQQEGLPAKTATTNSEGYLELMNMEVGPYTGFLRKPGFEDTPIELNISTGVISFKHYTINPAPAPPTPDN
jgi:hypothetical protein